MIEACSIAFTHAWSSGSRAHIRFHVRFGGMRIHPNRGMNKPGNHGCIPLSTLRVLTSAGRVRM